MSVRKLSRWAAASVVAFAVVLAAAPPALRATHLHWPAWLVALILASIVALGGVVKPLVDACTQAWAKHLTAEIELGQRRRTLIAEIQGDGKNLRRVSEMTDRALLGIHPAIPLPHTADRTLSAELPLYIPRDIDADLRAWLDARRNHGGLLLLVGPPAIGKTRCAYELLHSTVPDWSIFMPSTPSQVTEFSGTAYERNTVIWLNEIKNFLTGDGLTVTTVRRILTDSRPVLIVGTIWRDDFDNFMQPDLGIPEQAHMNQDSREILTVLAHRVDLPDVFSLSERHRASQLAERDPRIAEALSHPDSSNIATTLAAAPELIRRWVHGSTPYGRSVITAAVTARRCGHPQPVTEIVLRSMARTFLSNSDRAAAGTDWFPVALQWATQAVRGEAAPLTAHATEIRKIDGYRVSDVLVQYANNLSDAPGGPVQNSSWRTLIEDATPYACGLIGFAAVSQPQIAELAFRKAAKAEHDSAILRLVMARLGILLQDQGEDAEAETWWRKIVAVAEDWTKPEVNIAASGIGLLMVMRHENVEEWWQEAAEAGNPTGMACLAEVLRKRGDDTGADTWAARAAEAGNPQGMAFLAEVLRKRGDDTGAETWAARAAEAGNPQGMAFLAEVLRKRGDDTGADTWAAKAAEAKRTQEAAYEAWWRKPAEAGNPQAMALLAEILHTRGDDAEAETWWRAAAEAGSPQGMTRLGVLLTERGDDVEAETWWRAAAEAGNPQAMALLGGLLTKRGDDVEAEIWWRKAVTVAEDWTRPEVDTAVSGIALLIMKRHENVEEWWQETAEAGSPRGMASLAEILRKRGDDSGAETWAARAAQAGNLDGMACLAEILRKRGDDTGAETWAARAAQAGNLDGMACLAEILRKRGDDTGAETWAARVAEGKRTQEATNEAWCRTAAEAGNPSAMALLAGMLHIRGDDAEAETWWRAAAEAGNLTGMTRLGLLLREQGDTVDAEIWWRKAIAVAEDWTKPEVNIAVSGVGIFILTRGENVEEWWRAAAEAGNLIGMVRLAEILRKRGDDTGAETWAARAAQAGNLSGMACLAEILRKRGDDTGAETWAARAAEAKRTQEATNEGTWQVAAEAGNLDGMVRLAEILRKRGDDTGAETWAARAAQAGNLSGMACLAEILRKRGDDTGAETWAARAAEAGNPQGMACLAEILRKRGDDTGAETWAARAAEAGNPQGMACLAEILRKRGDDTGAQTWAARAAQVDSDMTK